MKTQTRYSAIALAILASTLVVACGEKKDATVGERLDGAVNEVQQASKEIRQDAAKAGQEMKEAGNKAADSISAGSADAAITAKVNAALASDTQLSALAIDVDTTNGHVELKGTAPTEAARARATQLATGVEGVTKVDNRLTVDSKG